MHEQPIRRMDIARSASKSLWSRIRPSRVHVIAILGLGTFLTGCATNEPVTRVLTTETFEIVPADDLRKRQEKSNVIIEDQGEVKNLVQPVSVQACNGPHLMFDEQQYTDYRGQKRIRRVRVMVDVDPLEGIYVRGLRVTNNTPNVLRLSRADAVLVDAARNDNEMADVQILAQNIRARLPFPSGDVLVRTLRSLKILGADVRIRPGRETTFYAMFPTADKSIVGDWVLELNDFPVETNTVGDVSKVEAFKFPLVAKGYRTEITQRRENWFAPWVETARTTAEIEQ